ncbi:MAG: transaldolase [Sulfuricurvum sp. RIFOXYD2_FULL_44_160]|uniref:Transaldolase n=1 Tax=Sulfuricurvum kujiense TaxID=148813 RepID=A0A2D3WM37_9BACT|nr:MULTISPECIES: transaldolase [Sulfuricurvum]OHD90860.1 MAG: transaldolase [Sulfuricurvum sp. RIFOXYD12_FULL_44_77]OHD96458.1 MAG: transaldolase [Sulfuricurvum sp. RIFOXYD2_FULL_44_160]DAB39376.1 MAG TPA: transaldolase [Sulfuricurvum kujiense]
MYLAEARFALWADFIERTFLDEGFKELIEKGVINGATSNPAIFKNAILTSPAYKEQLATLSDLSPKEKYEALAIYDIQKAADILRPLYDAGDDGYVSIEVDPFLCDDTEATIAEGIRLHASINRPNVMIKVPATEAGYGAMEALASRGIPVNATLIFSVDQALKCAEAFNKASKKSSVDTVISVFVSRIDRAIDETLRSHGVRSGLMGIVNAADIYNRVEALGISKCRVLFASTGVKGSEFRASYYIDELLAPNSVNTAPIATIDAYVSGGDRTLKLPMSAATIEEHQKSVAAAGVEMDTVIAQQIEEGLEAFKVAFTEILNALE